MRQAHRRGRTKGKIGFHGGKVEIERPRVRGLDGVERVLAELGERWRACRRVLNAFADADQRLDAAIQAFGPVEVFADGATSGVSDVEGRGAELQLRLQFEKRTPIPVNAFTLLDVA